MAERPGDRDRRTRGGQLKDGLAGWRLEAVGLRSAADGVSDVAPANYFPSDCTCSSSPFRFFAARSMWIFVVFRSRSRASAVMKPFDSSSGSPGSTVLLDFPEGSADPERGRTIRNTREEELIQSELKKIELS